MNAVAFFSIRLFAGLVNKSCVHNNLDLGLRNVYIVNISAYILLSAHTNPDSNIKMYMSTEILTAG